MSDQLELEQAARVIAGAPRADGQKTECDEAARQLSVEATRIARIVCRALGSRAASLKNEFVESAPGVIFDKLRNGGFDPALGKLEAWLKKVLRNAWTDELRKEKRHWVSELDTIINSNGAEETDEGFRDHRSVREMEMSQTQAAFTQRFCESDVRTLELLSKRPRLLFLLLAELHQKLEPSIWRRWVSDCDFEDPFPPHEFLKCPSDSQHEMLLTMFDMGPQNFSVCKHRIENFIVRHDWRDESIQYIRDQIRRRRNLRKTNHA